jgi:hypothetical protein
MTAATADRNNPRRAGKQVSDPVGAAKKLFVGSMYSLSATGFAVPAGTAGSGVARAVVQEQADNTAGADGAIDVTGETGVFRFDNSTAGDLIARADIGATCYIVDDSTVAKTDNTGARKAAGKIVDVDSVGVWVQIG